MSIGRVARDAGDGKHLQSFPLVDILTLTAGVAYTPLNADGVAGAVVLPTDLIGIGTEVGVVIRRADGTSTDQFNLSAGVVLSLQPEIHYTFAADVQITVG